MIRLQTAVKYQMAIAPHMYQLEVPRFIEYISFCVPLQCYVFHIKSIVTIMFAKFSQCLWIDVNVILKKLDLNWN